MTLSELQDDIEFLKGYLGLPVRLRRISAEYWAETFRTATDDMVRKTALVKIYEEFIASTEDLSMFFFALKDLGIAPCGVKRHCINFWVVSREEEWNDLLTAIPAGGHFLEGHLPFEDVPEEGRIDPEEIKRIFRKATDVLKSAAFTRVTGDRTLVRSSNKIRHGMLIQDAGDMVVLDITQSPESRIPVTLEYAEMLMKAVVAMRQVTAVIVSSLIQKMNFAAASRAYPLKDADKITLRDSFKNIPPTF